MDKYLNEDAITAEIMSYVKNRISSNITGESRRLSSCLNGSVTRWKMNITAWAALLWTVCRIVRHPATQPRRWLCA